MPGNHSTRYDLRCYYCLKFSLSFYATLFSIIGLLILCIGIYAESERQKHKTLEGIFLAPAVILLLLGIGMFVVSFIGMVGSLRDNLPLIKTFFWVLLIIFVIEILLIIIELLWENSMKEIVHTNIQQGIRQYYDDLDFKNIMDFVQEKAVGGVRNTLCGYQTLDKERLSVLHIIHVRGCIHAVGLWLKDNYGLTIAIVIALLAPQVLGLVLSFLFWRNSKTSALLMSTVDFKGGYT
ncbi:hypothetical protein FKM82_012133 [Ascaphus truei]